MDLSFYGLTTASVYPPAGWSCFSLPLSRLRFGPSGTLWVLCRAFSILAAGVSSSLLNKHPEKAHLAVPSRDGGKWKPGQHRDACARVGGCRNCVGLVLWGSIVQLWNSSVHTELTACPWALGSLRRNSCCACNLDIPSFGRALTALKQYRGGPASDLIDVLFFASAPRAFPETSKDPFLSGCAGILGNCPWEHRQLRSLFLSTRAAPLLQNRPQC